MLYPLCSRCNNVRSMFRPWAVYGSFTAVSSRFFVSRARHGRLYSSLLNLPRMVFCLMPSIPPCGVTAMLELRIDNVSVSELAYSMSSELPLSGLSWTADFAATPSTVFAAGGGIFALSIRAFSSFDCFSVAVFAATTFGAGVFFAGVSLLAGFGGVLAGFSPPPPFGAEIQSILSQKSPKRIGVLALVLSLLVLVLDPLMELAFVGDPRYESDIPGGIPLFSHILAKEGDTFTMSMLSGAR